MTSRAKRWNRATTTTTIKNPNWPEANHLAIFKCSREVEPGITRIKLATSDQNGSRPRDHQISRLAPSLPRNMYRHKTAHFESYPSALGYQEYFTKIYFLRIVLNGAKISCISKHHRLETRVSREAQKVCAITIVGTVLNPSSSKE